MRATHIERLDRDLIDRLHEQANDEIKGRSALVRAMNSRTIGLELEGMAERQTATRFMAAMLEKRSRSGLRTMVRA